MRDMVKDTAIIFCILFMIAMMWDSQKTDAAVAGGPIPQESIRLRILANSDNPDDQLVKREIRDAVVAEMDGWVQELEDPQSLEQARATIRERLPELNELVGRELEKRGIHYDYNVELGVVPFPTKLYGGTVYPAGNYEALRITLGAGNGQNWWCVLFPPLCFIDAASGDAAAQPADAKAQAADKDNAKGAVTTASAKVTGAAAAQAPEKVAANASQPQVRFFLVDMLSGLWSWLTGLFA
ncbi:stage II sporulation protein R [Paenibacillus sp. XY044]|uniref:stage II sporulation protein R n=1 Tax=Paenibacillus sp. XY044 TaxID=2026089 RepID=UPI0015C60E0E|nr:stage II sporulation protein R [Paenibacillus sp. XY044]